MRALERRPTTLERWPKGVHPGIVVSTREKGGGDAFFQKRVPRGAPDYLKTARIEFPSGRHADEICPTEVAVVGWAAQMGTITFHPWPVRERRRRPSRRAAHRPRPAAGHGLRGRRARGRRGAAAAGRPGLRRLPEDLRRPRRAHLRAHRAALDVHRRSPCGDRVRARAGAPPSRRGDHEVVEGGARRARVRRLQPERARPHDRIRLQRPAEARRTGVGTARVGRAGRRRSRRTSPSRRCPRASRSWATATRRSTTSSHSLQPLLDIYERDEAEGLTDMPYPPDYPKMPGEPKRVQPSRDRDRPKD